MMICLNTCLYSVWLCEIIHTLERGGTLQETVWSMCGSTSVRFWMWWDVHTCCTKCKNLFNMYVVFTTLSEMGPNNVQYVNKVCPFFSVYALLYLTPVRFCLDIFWKKSGNLCKYCLDFGCMEFWFYYFAGLDHLFEEFLQASSIHA